MALFPGGGIGYVRRTATCKAPQSTARTPTGNAQSFKAIMANDDEKEGGDGGVD